MAKSRQKVVTLLTDFGWQDAYVGAMKGQLLRHAPDATIVDLSHDVSPHNIVQAAFVLAGAAPFFPEGTLHVVVVDPGVGTERQILLAQLGGQQFLFPDNGVISLVQKFLPLENLVTVRDSRLWGSNVSKTFHGRDVFAPLAGQILQGRAMHEFGPRPERYRLLDLPAPRQGDDGLYGQILYVDHFGNCVTNLRRADLQHYWDDLDVLRVRAGEHVVGPIRLTYGHAELAKPLALLNSLDFLEVAVNQGRACDVLGLGPGAEVRVDRPQFVDS